MSEPEKNNRATSARDRGVGDRSLLVPSLRPSSDQLSQKPDRHNRCRLETNESVLIERLRGSERRRSIWTEDVMRLYADSFLPEGGGGRPFPTTYGGEASGWERTFPRCWLKENRATIEEELRRRFRRVAAARQFDKLRWYLQFIDHPSLYASQEVRQSLRRLLEGAVGRSAFQQAQRDFGGEAIDSLRQGLRTFAQGSIQRYAGNESRQFGRYASALHGYAAVVLNLAEGGTGDLPLYSLRDEGEREQRPDVQGAERGRAAWRALPDSHRSALRRRSDELRNAFTDEMRGQFQRVARKISYTLSQEELDSLARNW